MIFVFCQFEEVIRSGSEELAYREHDITQTNFYKKKSHRSRTKDLHHSVS